MENEQSAGWNRILLWLGLSTVFGVQAVSTIFTDAVIEKLQENFVEGTDKKPHGHACPPHPQKGSEGSDKHACPPLPWATNSPS